MGTRKIIQISSNYSPSVGGCYIYALCDDGTLWFSKDVFVSKKQWTQYSTDDIDPEGSRIEGKVI